MLSSHTFLSSTGAISQILAPLDAHTNDSASGFQTTVNDSLICSMTTMQLNVKSYNKILQKILSLRPLPTTVTITYRKRLALFLTDESGQFEVTGIMFNRLCLAISRLAHAIARREQPNLIRHKSPSRTNQ